LAIYFSDETDKALKKLVPPSSRKHTVHLMWIE